ncbi:hypothetical protein CAPTEDRAFT_121106, partial [Capitella teleta]
IISSARVTQINDVSPTVKKVCLKIEEEQMTFKAGQWLDFFIPALSTVGGYSMCSAPSQMLQNQSLSLAIKFSQHPPAHWIHNQCQVGSEVKVRVGGDFFYDPKPGQGDDLLLVAGGVGINPMLSIIQHVADLKSQGEMHENSVILLYSAKSLEELIFKVDLKQFCSMLLCSMFLYGRITQEVISSTLKEHFADSGRLQSYICGPSPMIDAMEQYLMSNGISNQQIHYEKWW